MAQRGVALLLLPLILPHVGSAEYGRLAIVWSVGGALAAITSFGLETAVFRGYFTLPPDRSERDRYIASNALFVLVVSLAGAAFLSAVGFLVLDSTAVPPDYLALSLVSAALYVSATAVPLAVLRAERRLAAFVSVNFAYVGTYVVGMVVLVVVREGGARGWLYATLLASAAATAVAFRALPRILSKPRFAYVTAGLALGLPLVPHALAHWGLSLSDRLILGAYVGVADIGVYNVAYQLAAGLGLVFVAVNHSVMADYGRALRGDLPMERLERMVGIQVAFVLIVGAAAAIAGPMAVDNLLPAAYGPAAGLLPWLVLANVLFALYLVPMNSITLLAGDTKWIWGATVVSAGVNIGLNVVLIPVAGTAAAAGTTVVGYALLLGIVLSYALLRGAPLPVRSIRRVAVALVACSALSAAALTTAPSDPLTAAAVGLAWLAGTAAVAVALLAARSQRATPSSKPAVHEA